MKRKGQAAMEFLMTYGWAILAAIIVIGVLAIYFRPSSIAPDAFLLEAPFTAGSAQASVASGVTLEITNNAGVNLNITNVSMSVTSPAASTCSDVTQAGIWAPGAKKSITFAAGACGTLTAGDQFRADVAIAHYESGSTLQQIGTGSITYGVIA